MFKGCNAKIQAQVAKKISAKGEIKELEELGEPSRVKELEKPNNASNDEPCHVRKIRLHNQNKKCCERPPS
jgi:hypothetical protein